MAGYLLREYVPLKQGLRLVLFDIMVMTTVLREYVPLKQGLRRHYLVKFYASLKAPRVCSTKTRIKTAYLPLGSFSAPLREYVPLKQGLRPVKPSLSGAPVPLREYVPLKQGLRRLQVNVNGRVSPSESMFH